MTDNATESSGIEPQTMASPPNQTSGARSAPNSAFGQVPIEIIVSVGRARPLIRDLLSMSQDSVLPLDRKLDDPVELIVGDRIIARGTLTEVAGDETGRLAVRLTEVSDLGKGF